jgi:hypothetical protein
VVFIYFAAGRVLYSLIERRDIPFVLLDILCSALFTLAALLPLTRLDPGLAVLIVFLGYMLTAMVPYALVRKSPIEATVARADRGNGPAVWFGIIDGSWLAIMGAACAMLTLSRQLQIVDGPLPHAGRSPEYYRAAFDETSFFLSMIVNAAFVLGTALSVCMAILWAGEIWRKRDPLSKTQYRDQTIASLKMVFAFFLVLGCAAVWVAVPLRDRLVAIRELLP